MPSSVLVDEGTQSLVYEVNGRGRGVVWQRGFGAIWSGVFVFDNRVQRRVGSRVLLAGSTTGELKDDADEDSSK
jgi:hypothetical protein